MTPISQQKVVPEPIWILFDELVNDEWAMNIEQQDEKFFFKLWLC